MTKTIFHDFLFLKKMKNSKILIIIWNVDQFGGWRVDQRILASLQKFCEMALLRLDIQRCFWIIFYLLRVEYNRIYSVIAEIYCAQLNQKIILRGCINSASKHSASKYVPSICHRKNKIHHEIAQIRKYVFFLSFSTARIYYMSTCPPRNKTPPEIGGIFRV